MKTQVKRFTEFLAEGSNPAHDLLRRAHSHSSGADDGSYQDLLDIVDDYEAMKPADRDRFDRVSARTRDWREADVNGGRNAQTAAKYRNRPDNLEMVLADEYFNRGSEEVAELVDRFMQDQSMTIDDLAQEISNRVTWRNVTPAAAAQTLKRYAR